MGTGMSMGTGMGAWYMHMGSGTCNGTGMGTTVCVNLISSRSICVLASFTTGMHSVALDSQNGLHEIILFRNCFTVGVICCDWVAVDTAALTPGVFEPAFVNTELCEPFNTWVRPCCCFKLLWLLATSVVTGVAFDVYWFWEEILLVNFFCCWLSDMFWLRFERAIGAVDLRANCFGFELDMVAWSRDWACCSNSLATYNKTFLLLRAF